MGDGRDRGMHGSLVIQVGSEQREAEMPWAFGNTVSRQAEASVAGACSQQYGVKRLPGPRTPPGVQACVHGKRVMTAWVQRYMHAVWARTHVPGCRHTDMQPGCKHTYLNAHIQTHSLGADIHAWMQRYRHTALGANIHAWMHTYRHTAGCKHTCLNAHIHTCILDATIHAWVHTHRHTALGADICV